MYKCGREKVRLSDVGGNDPGEERATGRGEEREDDSGRRRRRVEKTETKQVKEERPSGERKGGEEGGRERERETRGRGSVELEKVWLVCGGVCVCARARRRNDVVGLVRFRLDSAPPPPPLSCHLCPPDVLLAPTLLSALQLFTPIQPSTASPRYTPLPSTLSSFLTHARALSPVPSQALFCAPCQRSLAISASLRSAASARSAAHHNLYGFGFARKAIECLGVLAPEGVEVISGPCFIRCSRGVNARIVLPAKADTVPPPAMKRTRLAWGTGQATPLRSPGLLAAGFQDLFGLNSVEKCAETLREQGVDVPSQLLHAYERYAKAVVVLDESRAGGPSTSARAFEATPLLEVTTEFLLTHEAPPPASWPERLDAAAAAAQAPLIRARSDWANSRWRESFYRSELVVNAPSSPSNGTSESRSSGGDVGTLHGAEMHGAG
eukprot:scaffold75247_cov24-Tisochrysis_lutea.AAC.3